MKDEKKTKKQLIDELIELRKLIAESQTSVTERKRAEEKIRQSLKEWQTTFDSSKDLIMLLDRDFKIIQANRATADYFGKPFHELIGKSCYQLFHGTDKPPDFCPLERMKMTKKREEAEIFLSDKSIWINVTVDPVLDDHGEITRTVHIIRDITERKRAGMLLQESQAKYKAIFEATGTATLIVEEDTTIMMANRECFLVSGYNPEELIGTKWTNYVAPESLEIMLKYHKLRREDPSKAPRKYEVKLVNKNGEIRNAILDVGMISGTKQSVVSMLDITELKQVEEALRESENKYRFLFDAVPVAIGIASLDGRLLSVNRGTEELTGYTKEEFMALRNLSEIYVDHSQREQLIFLLQKEGRVRNFETALKRKDGTIFYVHLNSDSIKLGGEQVILTTIRDITERKQAEDALQFTRFSLDNAADVMICVGRDARFIDVNNACCRSWGYSREELLSMSVHDIDPDYSAEIWTEFWEKLKQSGSLTFESCHHTKEGKVYPVEIVATFFEYNGKEYHCSFARDITERKQAENALRQAEEKYRSIFDNAVEGIFQTTPEGRFLSVNSALARIYGYDSPEDMMSSVTDIGRQLYVYPEKRKEHLRLLNEKGVVKNFEAQMYRKDGSTNWVSMNTQIVRDDAGKPLLFEGFVEDITERKQAEDEIKSLSKFPDENPNPIFRIGNDGIVFYANEAAGLLLQSLGSAVGSPAPSL